MRKRLLKKQVKKINALFAALPEAEYPYDRFNRYTFINGLYKPEGNLIPHIVKSMPHRIAINNTRNQIQKLLADNPSTALREKATHIKGVGIHYRLFIPKGEDKFESTQNNQLS